MKPGLYWNKETYTIIAVDEGQEVDSTNLVKIPTVGMLVIAPIMGLAFAMTLPALGFILFGTVLIKKVSRYFARLVRYAVV
jgi:hypothetical protein